MIYFFVPYSLNKKLFEAYDNCMSLLQEDDWACFLDGDTMFFESNFGHQIQEYIDHYPDTGMFTCYSSRCAYHYMVPHGTNQEADSITYHRSRSKELYNKMHLQVKEINDHVSGHLMCMKKNTWMLIRPDLLRVTDGANLLGVDTQISNQLRGYGLKILLMRGIYLMHYYRLMEGKSYKEHLMDNRINILIRTSNRERLFRRCIDSIRAQTFKDVNILVSADDEKTASYVKAEGIDPVIVQKRTRNDIDTAPYNMYLNELMVRVKGGWIFILDDDDYLADSSVLKKVVEHLKDDNAIYFMKMRWTTGRIIPSPENFTMRRIVLRDIGMPCFIFHAKHKHKVAFDTKKQGDFRFVTKLMTMVKKQRWIDLIVTQIGNTGAYGKPEK
jgi:GT2 family glycosyltransferase